MPNTYTFSLETFVPRPQEEVFAFFSRAENLEKITPPKLRFKILTPLSITMQEGALIDYRIRLLGLPFKWRTEITLWEPPFRFRDVQLSGPYRKWEHTHSFEAADGGTRMRDEVHYQIPLDLLSPLTNRFFIRKQIADIFEHRKDALDAIFG